MQAQLIALLVAAAAFLGLLGAVHYYKSDRDVIQAQYESFKTQVKAEKEVMQAQADLKVSNSKLENERVQNTLTATVADNKRLLAAAAKDRAGRGYLPPVPTSTSGAGSTTCFDRPKLESALSRFGNGTADLIGEGNSAIILRDGWRKWFDAQAKVGK